MSNSQYRARAARILCELLAGNGSLTSQLERYSHSEEFPVLKETCFGCCRWYFQLSGIVDLLVNKPMKARDVDVRCLLIVALYQLRELSLPDYAVINESVSSAEQLGKPWAKSFINGVLRNYQRKLKAIEQELAACPAQVTASHPDWLVAELRQQWPDHWQQILDNNNLRPPMTLRVNLARASREQALALLADSGCPAVAGLLAPTAIYLEQPMAVDSLPGFEEGWLSIQDEASQLVPGLLALQPELRVLDACAAPGGKTCHILESEQSLTSLLALDRDDGRLQRISENLTRLGLDAELRCSDAGRPQRWWDQQEFDRILLDAPCSATGVIRRHPDIKLLRNPANVAELCRNQARLLKELWQCLKPGGLLLYTTCSLLREENEGVVAAFLDSTDNAKYEGITADWGVECRYGRQLLPGDRQGPDGFYYARIWKTGTALDAD